MRVRWLSLVSIAAAAVMGCQRGPEDGAVVMVDDVDPRQDSLLLAAAKVALPPGGVTPGDLPDSASPGARILATYCAQCHALPSPAAHGATDWPGVARRMWLRSEWLPGALDVNVPTMSERYVLLQYLTTHALRTSDPEALPPGPGRETFVETCGRCHAVPDPRVHSAEDWPVVYARMEQNMDRMNVTRPTGGQPAAILEYLRTASARR
jgi:cytochrome c5